MVRSIVHSTSEHVLCEDELKACMITETIIGGCVFSLIPRFFQSHSQPPPRLSATKLEKSLGMRMIHLHSLHVPTAATAISGWHCRWAVRGIVALPGAGLLEPGGSSPDVLLTNCDIHCSTGTACVHVCMFHVAVADSTGSSSADTVVVSIVFWCYLQSIASLVHWPSASFPSLGGTLGIRLGYSQSYQNSATVG